MTRYKFDVEGLYLHPGSKGVFEVSLDGELLFSKLQEHRFPEHEEIFEAIDRKRGT